MIVKFLGNDLKIADAKKKKKKKPMANNGGIKGFILSLIILILLSANLLFAITWLAHALEKMGMADTSSIIRYERVPNPSQQIKKLKVEVYNACGVQGVAKELTDYLRNFEKVDVVYYGNYDVWNIPETLVIDRRDDNISNAKIVGRIIGVKVQRVFPHLSPDRQVDVTILIGKNYEELKAFK